MNVLRKILLPIIFAILLGGCGVEEDLPAVEKKVLLNVSYDATRELYEDYNNQFKTHWEKDLGKSPILLSQSHGGTSKQLRAVIDGLEADVVTLAFPYELTELQNAGLIHGGWKKKFPNNASPYTSTILFLVRKDNPKNIHDWNDLIRDDVEIVMPNPKTSGSAQLSYLTAWEFAHRQFGNEDEIIDFMRKIFLRVISMEDGARGATNDFVQGRKGDVLVIWENEALLVKDTAPEKYDVVIPSLSILAEPSIAVIDKVVATKGTREIAAEYLNWLYSPEGQEIIAQNFYRPRDEKILAKYAKQFKPMNFFTIEEAFGDWNSVYAKHFSYGALFDQIYNQ